MKHTMHMTNRKSYSIKLVFLILIGVVTSWILTNKSSEKIMTIPFKTEKGWGYNIIIDDNIYIHQEYIPAVRGNMAFQSKEDAEKTGNLVIKKMRLGQFPSIKINEIDSLKIGLCRFD